MGSCQRKSDRFKLYHSNWSNSSTQRADFYAILQSNRILFFSKTIIKPSLRKGSAWSRRGSNVARKHQPVQIYRNTLFSLAALASSSREASSSFTWPTFSTRRLGGATRDIIWPSSLGAQPNTSWATRIQQARPNILFSLAALQPAFSKRKPDIKLKDSHFVWLKSLIWMWLPCMEGRKNWN